MFTRLFDYKRETEFFFLLKNITKGVQSEILRIEDLNILYNMEYIFFPSLERTIILLFLTLNDYF